MKLSEDAPLKIYLAGPEVFLPDAVELGLEKKRICAAYGAVGLFPLDVALELGAQGADRPLAAAIYEANRALMGEADIGIANLTPFRGPNVDDGTAFEVGYLIANNKPVFGYANMAMTLAERVFHLGTPDEMSLEDHGLAANLMLAHGIVESGGEVVLHQAPADALYTDLTAFERCVGASVAAFGASKRI